MPSAPNFSTISVPSFRLDQLKALAGLRKLTLTDLICQLAVDAMISGELPDVIPGTEVGIGEEPHTGFPKVTIRLGEHTAHMSAGAARQLADYLEAPRSKLLAMPVLNVIGSDAFRVQRRGTALSLSTVRHPEDRALLPPQVVTDIARQLRKAADVVAEKEAAMPQATTTRTQKPGGGVHTEIDFDSAR